MREEVEKFVQELRETLHEYGFNVNRVAYSYPMESSSTAKKYITLIGTTRINKPPVYIAVNGMYKLANVQEKDIPRVTESSDEKIFGFSVPEDILSSKNPLVRINISDLKNGKMKILEYKPVTGII